MVQDDKRTPIGPTGPVRPVTGSRNATTATASPASATPASAAPASASSAPVTPAPTPASPPTAGTSYLPPRTDPLLGQVLAGRYLLHEKLGEGGMGSVYLATHNVLEKQVALKVLHGQFARKPDLVERFMQEAKAASRIRHENVIDISDFGTTPEGLVFFAMELLQGHDLHEEIARARLDGRLLPWDRSKRIFLQLCAALSAAHALGIIHRDLKPENIYLVNFLGEPDFVKLLDFGIAKQTEVSDGDRKLTRTGMLFGTPEYMSPEQARGEPIDHRIDVYAMGCILFQLVTGKVPFESDNFMGVLNKHLTQPPPGVPPEVLDSIGAPRALADVIQRALAKDRDQRFATMDELARAVRHASGDPMSGPLIAQTSVPAPATVGSTGHVKTAWTGNLSLPEIDAKPPPRSKRPIILGLIVLAAGAAGAAVYVATQGGDTPGGNASASGAITSGSGVVTPTPTQDSHVASAPPVAPAPPAPSTPPVAPPAPSTPPVAPPVPPVAAPPDQAEHWAFEWAQIRINSTPRGADVKDLTNGTLIGRTPFTFKVKPSRTPRQFGLHRKNYLDAVVELIPDRQKIEHTEKLMRGTSRRTVRPGTDPALKPPREGDSAPSTTEPAAQQIDSLPLKTEPPPPAAAPPAPPAPPKPSDDDCEPPCLKADPSRAGSAK